MNDLIDRKALMYRLRIGKDCGECEHRHSDYLKSCKEPLAFIGACIAISQAPSLGPKKGNWIVDPDDCEKINCSCCKSSRWTRYLFETIVRKFNYCPHCGAEMKVTE